MSFNFSWTWTAFVGPKDISNPKSPYYVPPSSIGTALPPKDPEVAAAAAAAAAAEAAAAARKGSVATSASGSRFSTPRTTRLGGTGGLRPRSRGGPGNVLTASIEGAGGLGVRGLLEDSVDGRGGVAGLASTAPDYVHAKGLVPWGYAAHLKAMYIAQADEYQQAHPAPPPKPLPLPSQVKAVRVDPEIPKYLRFRSTMANPTDMPSFLAGVTASSTASGPGTGAVGKGVMAPRAPKVRSLDPGP
jgi:hypothetical protein